MAISSRAWPLRWNCSISSPITRASSSESQTPGDGWLLANFAIGEEGFAEPPLVMRDQARRDAEDMPGRAIIAFEPDDFRARKIGLEAQDVIDLGAAPAIDRLIVVADATEILAPLREQPQPQILGRVGVLIFIDEHIAEAFLIMLQDLGIFAKADARHSSKRSPKSAALRIFSRS